MKKHFTGLIQLQELYDIEELNELVDSHKRCENIEGRLEITKCHAVTQTGSIYEVVADEDALRTWDGQIRLASAGLVKFNERLPTEKAAPGDGKSATECGEEAAEKRLIEEELKTEGKTPEPNQVSAEEVTDADMKDAEERLKNTSLNEEDRLCAKNNQEETGEILKAPVPDSKK